MATQDPVAGNLVLGSRVEVVVNEKKVLGYVRYSGKAEFSGGEWLGVEIDDPIGKNDGSVQGKRYFTCEAQRGIFVRPPAARIVSQPGSEAPAAMPNVADQVQCYSTSLAVWLSAKVISIKEGGLIEVLVTAPNGSLGIKQLPFGHPHLKLQPAVAEKRKLELVVPEGTLPGAVLEYTAPDGQHLRVSVPEGVKPGNVMNLTQDPATKAWTCLVQVKPGAQAEVVPTVTAKDQELPAKSLEFCTLEQNCASQKELSDRLASQLAAATAELKEERNARERAAEEAAKGPKPPNPLNDPMAKVQLTGARVQLKSAKNQLSGLEQACHEQTEKSDKLMSDLRQAQAELEQERTFRVSHQQQAASTGAKSDELSAQLTSLQQTSDQQRSVSDKLNSELAEAMEELKKERAKEPAKDLPGGLRRGLTRGRTRDRAGTDIDPEWVSCVDPDTGNYFYVNRKTKRVTETDPKVVKAAVERQETKDRKAERKKTATLGGREATEYVADSDSDSDGAGPMVGRMSTVKRVAMNLNLRDLGRKKTFVLEPCAMEDDEDDEDAVTKTTSLTSRRSRANTTASMNPQESINQETAVSERSLIGLPRVTVIGVDHHDGEFGKQFFFEPDEWHDMVSATSSKAWSGKKYPVVQLRGVERPWRGEVIVNRSGSSCYGKRTSGDAWGQWDVGDVIILGSSEGWFSKNKWKVEDTVSLGPEDSMFDATLQRLDADKYPSVTTAVDALNAGHEICSEGICIVYSNSENDFFLVLRTDKKQEGLRVFYEVDEM